MSRIRNGYKESEIGVIPNNWLVTTLGEVVDITSGDSPNKLEFRTNGIPFFKVEQLNNCNKYQVNTPYHIDANSKYVKSGSIIFPKRGAAILLNKIRILVQDSYMDTNLMALTIRGDEKLNSEFLYYYLLNANLYKIADTTSIPQINNKHIIPYKIALPSKYEQEKIVEILSTWDSAIEKQEQLIEKKKEFKRGLMQRLLSGEIRFNKDNGQSFPEWRKVKLGEYLIKHNEKSEFNNQYPVLTSSRKGIFLQSDYYAGNDVASDDTTGYNVVPRGYFTYRHMSDDLVFKFNINDIVDKGIVSTLYPVFTVKGIDSYFLKVKLNEGDEFKKFALAQKQGGSRTYMYFSKLESLQMNIPSLEEQEKISEVLKLADKEIDLLEKELEALKLQKKGLMQRLLTGEVRVKV